MRREKTSVSREDYLKAIWEMVQEEHEPISARLAEELGVTPPAVTAALKRMTRDGLLVVRRDGRISLTRKGSSLADRLAMRHQLAEKLLTEVIGLDWTRAHDEAEHLEHGISPEVEKLLLARFGAEGFCPHGVRCRAACKIAAQARRDPAFRRGDRPRRGNSLRLRKRRGISEISLRPHSFTQARAPTSANATTTKP